MLRAIMDISAHSLIGGSAKGLWVANWQIWHDRRRGAVLCRLAGKIVMRDLLLLVIHLLGRVGGGIAPPASLRTERDTLASLSSHQANVPVIPMRQCTRRCALRRANFCKKWLARVLRALKRLNFRIAKARSV